MRNKDHRAGGGNLPRGLGKVEDGESLPGKNQDHPAGEGNLPQKIFELVGKSVKVEQEKCSRRCLGRALKIKPD